MRFRLGLVLTIAVSTTSWAQVTLLANKSSGSIDLSWSGGTGPFDVVRATSPRMTANTAVLASGTGGSGFTDTGAAGDAVGLYCYIVSDVASKPGLNITMPCDTPPGGPLCNSPTTQRTIAVQGTTTAGVVTVNDVAKAAGGGTFSAVHFDGATELPGVVLSLGSNLVTAAAKNATEDWAIDQIIVTRSNGNLAPTIAIAISDRGGPVIPADGAVIYDPTPEITVTYTDPEGVLNPNSLLRVYINGTEKAANFSKGALAATYQIPSCPCPPGEEWSAGSNFIYATIQDGTGYSSSASAHVTLSPPTITSFSPSAEGAVGDTRTINGAGFNTTPANNSVTFNGVAAMVTGATSTTLTVVLQAGSQTGPVVASVEGRSSKSAPFRVLLASGFLSISSVAIDPQVSNHVFFTDRSTNDQLYEVMPSGSVVSRCSLNEATGLPIDSSGNLYFGLGLIGGTSGALDRYLPASTTCQPYVSTTKVIGETTASVFGAALTEVGGLNVYSADNENARIKRIDPALTVSRVTSEALVISNPTGMAINSAGSTLYFTSTNAIRSLPIPGGSVNSTLVRNLVGSPKGMAVTTSGDSQGADKLILTRSSVGTNVISWYDPANSTNPFWDLASGFLSPPVLQGVARGSDGAGSFLVVAETSKVYRLPKPSVVLTDAADATLPTKLIADFAPGTTDCLGANTITLKVKFSPATLIPDVPQQLLTWTVEDPDDPSSDLNIDPNDTSGPTPNDNVPQPAYTLWDQVTVGATTYTMVGGPTSTATTVQTAIVGGVSEVTFHMSCQPGDNYKFVAQVTAPVYGTIEARSDVLTVWRRLHIERDSMGVALGPFKDDDAVIGDIPDPALDLLASAFKAAYVEVVVPTDTTFDTPDVRFKYNVPATAPDVNAQANLGRRTTSTKGYWVAYAQWAYEGDVAEDGDPDNEPFPSPTLGITASNRNSLSFVETIRDASALASADNEYTLSANVLHELGHQFGLGEGGCIMGPAPVLSPVFCPDQIFTIRRANPPSAP